MSYLVVPSSFSPKCPKFITGAEPENVHSISYCKCNFNCEFCFFKYYTATNNYVSYDENGFEQLVKSLMPRGKTFKFTGGEPTLNPELRRDLRIVKNAGGKTFLDTNGSSPQIVSKLMEDGLVDLFGISLKGLTEEEAVRRSGCKNSKHCWNNVLDSFERISNRPECSLIVTYVCYDDFSLKALCDFASILSRYPDVYLKINNYQPNAEHPTPNLHPMDREALRSIIEQFIKLNPQWHHRVTLVNGREAVENFSDLILM